MLVYEFSIYSSATVYGDPECIPITENCKIGNTTNPYGTSKFMVEKILADALQLQNLNLVLRYYAISILFHKVV